VTLSAYAIGLWLYPDELIRAGTMAFVTLSFSELLRAFTARSERYPIYRIGLFSNKWMVLAVSSSLLLLLATVYVPFLQPVFDTVALELTEWSIILPLILVPAFVAEITKYVLGLRERFALAG
jgi:Ca2+-transporting ATPase